MILYIETPKEPVKKWLKLINESSQVIEYKNSI